MITGHKTKEQVRASIWFMIAMCLIGLNFCYMGMSTELWSWQSSDREISETLSLIFTGVVAAILTAGLVFCILGLIGSYLDGPEEPSKKGVGVT
jgi:hypothetical protein